MEENDQEKNATEDGENNEENSPPPKKRYARIFLLFAVIIIEGYIVLSTELLAIRQTYSGRKKAELAAPKNTLVRKK